jgi:glycosyltransferase involved in cell wall biosynthesis
MKILFISSQFPNSLEPNRGIFSFQIVKELASFTEVRVIAPLPTLGWINGLSRFKKHKTDLNVPVYEEFHSIPVYHPRYLALPKMGLSHQWTFEIALKKLLHTIHAEWSFDVVNCHWLFPDGVAIQRICQQMNIPVMLTPLGTDLNAYCEIKLRRYFIAKALAKAQKVSVLNEQMKTKCLSLGVASDRLTIIPNGVDLDEFCIMDTKACRKKLNINSDIKMLLFVGSLVPVKNISSLLHAFSLLHGIEMAPDTKLYIVGGGFLEKELKALALDLKIAEKTVFVGSVLHSDLPTWMNAADCLCLPSLSEGHPNVMMEALACGTPVVGSNVGSIPDFVNPDDDNGFVIEATDVKGIAEKLITCLTQDYSHDAVRQSVLQYSWQNCAKRYAVELDQIC